MISGILFSFGLMFGQFISYYGLTIPIEKDLKSWSQSTKNIDFLDESFDLKSLQILRLIDETGEFTDWQKVQLSIKTAKHLFPDDTTKNTILNFFLLKNLQYDLVAAYNRSNDLIPLVASEQNLYGIAFFKIGGVRYYDLLGLTKSTDSDRKAISIHNDDTRTDGTKKLYIDFEQKPFTGKILSIKTLSWNYKENTYSFDVSVNIFLRSYYHDLPNLDYSYLLNYQFSDELRKTLIDPLRIEFTKQKLSDVERAECLRQMILQCFPYIDDDALFGYEHIQFPEELLLSEGCDCEDRAIFLYKLLIELTDLTPLLADYPMHVSVLVEDHDAVEGTRFYYKGKSFIYCDPTFFNAPIGAVPDAIKDIQPDIIERKSRE